MRKLSLSGSVEAAAAAAGDAQSANGEATGVGPGFGLGVVLGVAAADGIAAVALPAVTDVGGLFVTVAAVGFARYPARARAVPAATVKTPAAMVTPVSRDRPDPGSQPLLGCI